MKNTISTNERIFQVFDFEGEVYLCNLVDLGVFKRQLYFGCQPVKSIKHYWNFNFVPIPKTDVLSMLFTKNLNQ